MASNSDSEYLGTCLPGISTFGNLPVLLKQ